MRKRAGAGLKHRPSPTGNTQDKAGRGGRTRRPSLRRPAPLQARAAAAPPRARPRACAAGPTVRPRARRPHRRAPSVGSARARGWRAAAAPRTPARARRRSPRRAACGRGMEGGARGRAADVVRRAFGRRAAAVAGVLDAARKEERAGPQIAQLPQPQPRFARSRLAGASIPLPPRPRGARPKRRAASGWPPCRPAGEAPTRPSTPGAARLMSAGMPPAATTSTWMSRERERLARSAAANSRLPACELSRAIVTSGGTQPARATTAAWRGSHMASISSAASA
jgi:hypothetical protein